MFNCSMSNDGIANVELFGFPNAVLDVMFQDLEQVHSTTLGLY